MCNLGIPPPFAFEVRSHLMKFASFHPRTHPSFPKKQHRATTQYLADSTLPLFSLAPPPLWQHLEQQEEDPFFPFLLGSAQKPSSSSSFAKGQGRKSSSERKRKRISTFLILPPPPPFLTSPPSPFLAIPVICLLRPVPNFPLPGFFFLLLRLLPKGETKQRATFARF